MASGLFPWWVYDGGEPERLFIPLRNSRQSAKYDELKRQRWFYRLALGQAHQEDFIERIERHVDLRANFSLNLSAWSPVRRDSIQTRQSGKSSLIPLPVRSSTFSDSTDDLAESGSQANY